MRASVVRKIIRTTIMVAIVLPPLDASAGDDCESAFIVKFPPTETQWANLITQESEHFRVHIRPGIETQHRMPLEAAKSWWNEGALWVQPAHDGVRERYSWDSIDRIDIRRVLEPRSRSQHIGRGAGVGFLLGVAVGAAILAAEDDSESTLNTGPTAAGVIAITGALGAVGGALIGASWSTRNSQWVPVFCAETSTDTQP